MSKLGRKRSQKKARLVRLGQREIETLGLRQRFWSDLYHRCMTVSWPVFFGSAASLFVALNAVFGFLYSLGHEPIANAVQNGPLAYFYFSIETLATVGYGDMHPQTNYGHLIATIVDPEFQVASDIRLLPCYGHSPGMLLVEISGGSKGIIAGGDPLHHPLQVLDPNVNTGFCEKPDEAAASRHAFLARCADEGWAIAPTHFLVPRVTKVRRVADGFDLMQ